MSGIYILFGILTLISYLVSNRLKSKFKRYSNYSTLGKITGKEVAEKMLRENGVNDVKVVSVRGMLTDHYNPANKTVNLSEGVYNQATISAAAVAAHECGHAIQHATAYSWLQMRSKLVPIVSFTSKWVQWALVWLEKAKITSSAHKKMAKEALKWAAYTYVVAALSALATLMYYIMIYMRRR